MRISRASILLVILVLAWPGAVLAQISFEPDNCDFRVWFVAQPLITKTALSMADGEAVESIVAELNPLLDDGYAHYFRAECAPGDFRGSQADLIESMAETARINGLQDPKIWAEELPDGLAVGRLRAKLDSGLRIYTLDIRRYLGEASMLDVWAGAERFPTEGIVMFFKSVAYRGRFLYEK